MNKILPIVTLVLICSLIPSVAFANAGTPLIWASLLHLTVGNLFIGIFETTLIRNEKLKYEVSIVGLIIVLANYVSMACGWGISFFTFAAKFPDTTPGYILQCIGVYLLLTVCSMIIEFPFFRWVILEINNKQLLNKVIKINVYSALIVGCFYILFHFAL